MPNKEDQLLEDQESSVEEDAGGNDDTQETQDGADSTSEGSNESQPSTVDPVVARLETKIEELQKQISQGYQGKQAEVDQLKTRLAEVESRDVTFREESIDSRITEINAALRDRKAIDKILDDEGIAAWDIRKQDLLDERDDLKSRKAELKQQKAQQSQTQQQGQVNFYDAALVEFQNNGLTRKDYDAFMEDMDWFRGSSVQFAANQTMKHIQRAKSTPKKSAEDQAREVETNIRRKVANQPTRGGGQVGVTDAAGNPAEETMNSFKRGREKIDQGVNDLL